MTKVLMLFLLGITLALVVLFLGIVAYAQWQKYEARRTRNRGISRLMGNPSPD